MKLGAFGSSTERNTFWVKKSDAPPPGQYDTNTDMADATADLNEIGKKQKARVMTSSEAEHRKANSVFTSTVNRFDLNYSNKHPDVRLLTSNGVPRKKYVTQTLDNKVVTQDQKDIGIENQITCLGYSSQGQSEWKH